MSFKTSLGYRARLCLNTKGGQWAWWAKAFASKLDDLSLIFGTHVVEEEKQLPQVVL